MNNRVELVFEKTLTSLAGYPFGEEIYKEQVEGKIDLNQPFEFVFPPQIKGVASSFVQGFFEVIVSQIGLLDTEKRAHIISAHESFAEKFMSKLR